MEYLLGPDICHWYPREKDQARRKRRTDCHHNLKNWPLKNAKQNTSIPPPPLFTVHTKVSISPSHLPRSSQKPPPSPIPPTPLIPSIPPLLVVLLPLVMSLPPMLSRPGIPTPTTPTLLVVTPIRRLLLLIPPLLMRGILPLLLPAIPLLPAILLRLLIPPAPTIPPLRLGMQRRAPTYIRRRSPSATIPALRRRLRVRRLRRVPLPPGRRAAVRRLRRVRRLLRALLEIRSRQPTTAAAAILRRGAAVPARRSIVLSVVLRLRGSVPRALRASIPRRRRPAPRAGGRRLVPRRLDLAPQGVGGLAVAAVAVAAAAGEGAAATAGGAHAGREDVVVAFLDGARGQELVELAAVGGLLGPSADGVEHFALDLDAVVADGGVVEGAEDVVDDFVDGDAGVFPGVDDAAGGGG